MKAYRIMHTVPAAFTSKGIQYKDEDICCTKVMKTLFDSLIESYIDFSVRTYDKPVYSKLYGLDIHGEIHVHEEK